MISFAAEGRFAAEFLAFLVAVAGLALVGWRAELLSERRTTRAALAVGFALVATTSFLQGSLIVGDRGGPVIVSLRVAGIAALALASLRWAGGRRSRRLLWIGLAGMGVGVGLLAAGTDVAGNAVLGLGAAAIAVSLRMASARSISARVAASSAAILLLVVLVLAVSLSAVLSTTVRDDAGRRLDARAALEAEFAQTDQTSTASVVARNVALTFDTNGIFAAATQGLVSQQDPASGALSPVVQGYFRTFQSYLAGGVALAYIYRSGYAYAEAAPPNFDARAMHFAEGSNVVRQAFEEPSQGQRAAVQTNGTSAFVVAVQTVLRQQPDQSVDYPTAIVAIKPLDNDYLTVRRMVDPNVSLAMVSRTAVLGQAGTPGTNQELLGLATRALDSGGAVPLATAGGRLFSARSLLAGDQPSGVVLVASTPATVVTDVRDKLLRTLFLLAMGGMLLALALAAYAGERVSGGIRVLTQAARRVQAGDFSEPAGIRSEDEVGVLGTAFDSMSSSISAQTTALQRAAEDESALRNQLAAVVAGMGEALIAVDADGRVTLFNRAAEELLEADGEAVTGALVGDVLVAQGEDGTELGARLQRPLPSRWATTATVATELGPRIPVAISASALRGTDGGVAGGVLVLRDLRPERAVERVKSEFLSRIGHELRTPLTGILGYAEILLRRSVPEPRAQEMHQQIVDAGRRLYRVVQMLEFSAAAEAGRSLLRSEPLNVRTVVDEVVTGWGTRVNGNHALSRRVARSLPEVRGDRRWLAMAIDELIDNAVKFSPAGGKVGVIATTVAVGVNGDRRTAVQVSVVDEGVGMTDGEQREAFADFVQGDGSDTRRFGGLGLGLSLVKRVAEAHGGDVEVVSVPDQGSRISIIIPSLSIDEGG